MDNLQEFGDYPLAVLHNSSVAEAADQELDNIHISFVCAQPIRDGHPDSDTHIGGAVASDDRGLFLGVTHRGDASVIATDSSYGDQVLRADHPSPVAISDDGSLIAPVVAELREQHRQRQDLHRAEKSLTLQIKAKCRRLCAGDKKAADVLYKAMLGKADHEMAGIALAANVPFIEARAIVEKNRKAVEKRLVQLAKLLPVAPWIESVHGLGFGSLAAIVGECGDLSNYDGPAKVWKRMGLAVMSDGTRQRMIGGAEAMEHGYSPSRRSIAWNVAAAVFKVQSGDEPGPYRMLYDERKAYELPRVETAGHAHNRALRYIGKRILRDLWVAWRRETRKNLISIHCVSPAN